MTDWAVPQQAKLKYTQLFNLHDRARSGFLSGLQCRDILLQSGLTRNVLAEIWNLSDIDGDGQLTREEFILAMHLTNFVRSGNTLPAELPPDLVPPSYRRTRSVSTASVQSVASVGSSVSATNIDLVGQLSQSQKSTEKLTGSFTAGGSILNANSFEDKRRENFEKGKAELERRRLKVIEQQSSVIREQLASSKKQVAEAKAKIDAMRTERDTKMGLITSLEAQIKTLQDRKTLLDSEKLNLIAIAKDLNVMNQTQSEVDTLAVQAKLQSINQLKEKFQDIIDEKDLKAKELDDVNNRLEVSKLELKTLTETAVKRYEEYKKKVVDAKEIRTQIINENKSQTVDLDSAWGDDPIPPMKTSPAIETSSSKASSAIDDPWASSIGQPNAFTSLSSSAAVNAFDYTGFGSTIGPAPSNVSPNLSSLLIKPDAGTGIADPFGAPTQTMDSLTKEKKYKALYAFEARNPDELTINPGDVIVGTDEVCEPGWLSGKMGSRSGLFPEAYVEPVSENTIADAFNNNIPSQASQQAVVGTDIASMIAEELSSNNNNNNNNNISSNSNSSTAQIPSIKYKVLYAFEARNPDELTINPGDIVTGLEGAPEPGWLFGELGLMRGLFPESYVEKIAESAPDPSSEGGKSRAKRAEVATVIANYRALGQEQLNLEKGQLVLIRRKMDSGWWEGEIQIKGKKKQFGWFPASYVKLLSNSSGSASQSATNAAQ